MVEFVGIGTGGRGKYFEIRQILKIKYKNTVNKVKDVFEIDYLGNDVTNSQILDGDIACFRDGRIIVVACRLHQKVGRISSYFVFYSTTYILK